MAIVRLRMAYWVLSPPGSMSINLGSDILKVLDITNLRILCSQGTLQKEKNTGMSSAVVLGWSSDGM